jgi:hypothetical protein
VIVKPEEIVMLAGEVALCAGFPESVTLIVKLEVPPAPDGVPLIVQLVVFKLNPAGGVPVIEKL